MANEIPQDVLKRLNKLLNLAEGARAVGSLAEAENAAGRAQQLLMQYNLSEEEARAFGTTKKPIGEQNIETSEMTQGKEGNWIADLYNCIARNNLCYVLFVNNAKKAGAGKNVILFGTEANRQVVEYFAGYLIPLIRGLARKAFSEYRGHEKRGAFIRAFLTGCVQSIAIRLATTVQQMQQQDTKITALITTTGQEVQAYVQGKYRVKTGRSTTKRSASGGLEMGREAGRSVSLNKGVNGGSTFNRGLLG